MERCLGVFPEGHRIVGIFRDYSLSTAKISKLTRIVGMCSRAVMHNRKQAHAKVKQTDLLQGGVILLSVRDEHFILLFHQEIINHPNCGERAHTMHDPEQKNARLKGGDRRTVMGFRKGPR